MVAAATQGRGGGGVSRVGRLFVRAKRSVGDLRQGCLDQIAVGLRAGCEEHWRWFTAFMLNCKNGQARSAAFTYPPIRRAFREGPRQANGIEQDRKIRTHIDSLYDGLARQLGMADYQVLSDYALRVVKMAMSRASRSNRAAADVGDVQQEVLHTFLNSLLSGKILTEGETSDMKPNWRAWMFRVAQSKVADAGRGARRRARLAREIAALDGPFEGIEEPTLDGAIAQEVRDRLELIEEPDRSAVKLWAKGRTSQQIASSLGIPSKERPRASSAWKIVQRGLSRMIGERPQEG